MTRPPQAAKARSRQAILHLLKTEAPLDAQALAARLEISPMAVRQHLYGLQGEGLVSHTLEPRPVGRPAKAWRLTAQADRFFPDGHADLTLGLIGAMKEAFGAEGLERLLAVRAAEQIEAYGNWIGAAGQPLERRLAALARIRSEEGYMAAVETEAPGRYLLVENHCPICAAASACQGLCASELQVFRAALGADVTVERIDHIPAGARRCAYRVTAKT
jgi:predicted ArsR family transcriptional regulator